MECGSKFYQMPTMPLVNTHTHTHAHAHKLLILRAVRETTCPRQGHKLTRAGRRTPELSYCLSVQQEFHKLEDWGD